MVAVEVCTLLLWVSHLLSFGFQSRYDPFVARQDAIEVKSWVKGAHNARLDMDGPPPSQRAIDSLSAVRALHSPCRECHT